MAHTSRTRAATDPDSITAAARILRDGGIVAMPTETVYGLAADATNARAVARIFEAKRRPAFNPLIVHVPDLAEAEALIELPPPLRALARKFWPGPLTLVARARTESGICQLVRAGLDTLAVRVPAASAAKALLRETGRPLAAPSANTSGRVSPTTAAHVAADLAGAVDLILDAGPCVTGLESTIAAVDETGAVVILRPGSVTEDDISETLSGTDYRLAESRAAVASARPSAPGQLASHYAPRSQLRLEARDVRPGEALLAFGEVPRPMREAAATVLNLSEKGDLVEAAANLFARLHEIDETGASMTAVMPVPGHGLGRAINDRLRRAAAPRPGPAAPGHSETH